MRAICILCVLVATVSGGCGHSAKQETGPLPASERVLREDEIDGFIVKKEAQLRTSPDAFFSDVNFFPAPVEVFAHLRNEIKQAGFVAGAVEELGAVNNEKAGGGSIVVELDSSEAAKRIAENAYEASVSPCPHLCNIDFSDLAVPDVPGAKGSGRLRSEEESSPENPPFEGYEVFFADGSFVYVLYTDGRPGDVEGGDLVDAAQAFYQRVHGRPET